MAIKRVTVEVDDSPSVEGSTAAPNEKDTAEFTADKRAGLTGDTVYTDEPQPQTTEGRSPLPITTGRTIADLVSEFAGTPRAMATALMFFPFIVFVAKIDSIESMLYPLLVGALLNCIWFGVPWLGSLASESKRE